MYHSEEVRRLAPEMDPLRLGMGWKLEDLEKPKVIIESTFGDSHPGSAHLLKFVDTAAAGVAAAGGRAARYFTTDICDGMAQGHDGINYSLASRDMIANMVEIHNNATPFDAGVFIASCDKGLPGLLMGIGRTDLPAVVVTGGVIKIEFALLFISAGEASLSPIFPDRTVKSSCAECVHLYRLIVNQPIDHIKMVGGLVYQKAAGILFFTVPSSKIIRAVFCVQHPLKVNA